jgi:protein-S-isoprenylcysteine O-methyltransferase Ste14
MYLVLFLVGVYLDVIFKFEIFPSSIMTPVGVVFLVLGSVLVLWAQKTSRNLDIQNLSKESFHKGPYRYTRSPTHVGLFLLVFGFGVMINALFVIIATIIASIIAKFVFLEKQENVLIEKYGTHYLEYKKSVKL